MTKEITRRTFCSMLLALSFPALAAQPSKIPRLGYLSASSIAALSDRIEAFRQGLRELGYVEGKNINIEWRSAEGKFDGLPGLAAELVRLKVDIIVTADQGPTRAAKDATATIPIVMTQSNDPVGEGLIASLGQPGGSITGLSNLAPELSGKRLELLKETIPKATRIAVFKTSTQPGTANVLNEMEVAARELKVKPLYFDVLTPKDIETAFRAAGKGPAEAALVMVAGGVANVGRNEIVELAVKHRLPAIYYDIRIVDAGGLMFYGANILDLDRRAATFVDKILNGRTPRDLPVERPIKFEFIVNLPAARKIGLTIPPNVLVRADRVIR